MTKARILFDECIGKPHVERLAEFVGGLGLELPEIKHVLEFQEQGVWDEEWIPRIADEGWMVVTQDRGKRRKGRGEPLPRLCLAHNITHVLFSRRIAERKSAEKVLTLTSVWNELLSLAEAPIGSRYSLEPHSSTTPDSTRGRLINRTPGPRPTPKGRLFDPN